MKLVPLLLVLPLAFATQSCEVVPGVGDPPGLVEQYEELKAEEADARKANDEARLTEIQAEMSNIEAQILRDRAGPVVAGLSAVWPPLAPLSPFLLGLLPLAGKRGRKHFVRGAKAIIPGTKGPNGKRGPDPVTSVMSLLSYVGIRHSSKESEKAFDATTPEGPKPTATT